MFLPCPNSLEETIKLKNKTIIIQLNLKDTKTSTFLFNYLLLIIAYSCKTVSYILQVGVGSLCVLCAFCRGIFAVDSIERAGIEPGTLQL